MNDDDDSIWMPTEKATLDDFDAALEAGVSFEGEKTKAAMQELINYARSRGAKGNDCLFEFLASLSPTAKFDA